MRRLLSLLRLLPLPPSLARGYPVLFSCSSQHLLGDGFENFVWAQLQKYFWEQQLSIWRLYPSVLVGLLATESKITNHVLLRRASLFFYAAPNSGFRVSCCFLLMTYFWPSTLEYLQLFRRYDTAQCLPLFPPLIISNQSFPSTSRFAVNSTNFLQLPSKLHSLLSSSCPIRFPQAYWKPLYCSLIYFLLPFLIFQFISSTPNSIISALKYHHPFQSRGVFLSYFFICFPGFISHFEALGFFHAIFRLFTPWGQALPSAHFCPFQLFIRYFWVLGAL